MNCNKVKQMKIKEADIVEAIKSSTEVELSKDNKKVRRIGNKALPAKSTTKKRDSKAQDKEDKKNEEKKEGDSSDVELDEKGFPILDNKDFENP